MSKIWNVDTQGLQKKTDLCSHAGYNDLREFGLILPSCYQIREPLLL